MSLSHAVIWIDHHSAQVVQFNADTVETQTVKAHVHYTRQHGSSVRTEHEFFGEVCDALKSVGKVLTTGPHIATADFRHYVEKHRPALAPAMVGWETADHPTEGQLLAQGRAFFLKFDNTAAVLTTP